MVRVTRARPARLPARSRRGEAASFRLFASLVQRRPPPHRGPIGRLASSDSAPTSAAPPVSFGAFPVYQVVLWAVAVGGAAQVISGAARLGSADGSAARLGGSALLRRLGSSAALLLLVLPRRFFVVSLSLVWLRHPRARSRDAARRHARGGYDRGRCRDRARKRRRPERAATSGGLAAPRDAAQLREAAVTAGWWRRRDGVVAPRFVVL